MKCFNKVIEIDPNSRDASLAWSNKGVVFWALSKDEEAMKCFDKAIDVDPNSSNGWNGKGLVFSALRNYEEAISCFDKAIDVDPNSSNKDIWSNK